MSPPERDPPEMGRYVFHPAFLDACLQPIGDGLTVDGAATRTFMLAGA